MIYHVTDSDAITTMVNKGASNILGEVITLLSDKQLNEISNSFYTTSDADKTSALTLSVKAASTSPDDMIVVEARVTMSEIPEGSAMIYLTRSRLDRILREMSIEGYSLSEPTIAIFKEDIQWECFIHLR